MGKNTVCITEQHICKQGKLLIHSVQVKDTITWCCLNISTALGLMEVKLCICLNRKRDKTKYGSKNIKEQNMHVHEGQIMAFMARFPCFNTVYLHYNEIFCIFWVMYFQWLSTNNTNTDKSLHYYYFIQYIFATFCYCGPYTTKNCIHGTTCLHELNVTNELS